MAEESSTTRLTLAEKLDRLFKRAYPGGRGEYSYEEVAEGVNRRGGTTISATYLWELRTGKKDNPRKKHLEAIADFFGIPPRYFFDDDSTARIDAQLELFAAMREAGIRQLALRATDLSPETLHTIAQLIERARQLEGLPNGEGQGEGGSGQHESDSTSESPMEPA